MSCVSAVGGTQGVGLPWPPMLSLGTGDALPVGEEIFFSYKGMHVSGGNIPNREMGHHVGKVPPGGGPTGPAPAILTLAHDYWLN